MNKLNYRWPLHLTLFLDALIQQSPQPLEHLRSSFTSQARVHLPAGLELTDTQIRKDATVALKKLVDMYWRL